MLKKYSTVSLLLLALVPMAFAAVLVEPLLPHGDGLTVAAGEKSLTLPVARFRVMPNFGVAPLQVFFTDESTMSDGTVPGPGIMSWLWNLGTDAFGQPIISTERNPVYTYDTPYPTQICATLTVTTAQGSDTTQRCFMVTDRPHADFRFSIASVDPTKKTTTVNFSSDPTSSFANDPIIQYQWSFGDGATATGIGASHTYALGTYVATLTVTTDYGGTDSISKTLSVTDGSTISPCFYAIQDPRDPGNNGQREGPYVKFSDASSPAWDMKATPPVPGTITSWQLDFGDEHGTKTAVLPGPPDIDSITYTYDRDGVYTVTLTVMDSLGNQGIFKTQIWVSKWLPHGPYASFTTVPPLTRPGSTLPVAPQQAHHAPFTISFTDTSVPGVHGVAITNWRVDFGDANLPSVYDFTTAPAGLRHTYTQPGNYKLVLDLWTNGDTTTSPIAQIYEIVEVNGADVTVGTAQIINGPSPLQIQFFDNTPGVVSWSWNLGDTAPGGQQITSNDQNPTYSYPNTNAPSTTVYTVTVTETTAAGVTSTQPPITIEVVPSKAPIAAFTWDPELETFTDASSVPAGGQAIDEWFWDFANFAKPLIQLGSDNYHASFPYRWYEGFSGYLRGAYPATLYVVSADGVSYPYRLPGNVVVVDATMPTASFTVSTGPTHDASVVEDITATGDAPFTAYFTDGSLPKSAPSSSIASWTLDFGDGTPAYGPKNSTFSPGGNKYPHTYQTPGTYVAKLTVVDNDGMLDIFSAEIDVAPPPAADFTISTPGQGTCAPLAVTFTDTTVPGSLTKYVNGIPTAEPIPILQWQWDFGDGGSIQINSTKPPQFTHVYKEVGTYEATLTVTDATGLPDNSSSKTMAIDVTCVSASFAVTPASWSGAAPLEMHFTDGSSADSGIVGWAWDFGDGGTSTDQSPVYTFNSPGVFTVTLTVTTATGATATSVGTVTVLPKASATATPSTGSAPLQVGFTDATTVNPLHPITQWAWNFGDGTTFTTRTAAQSNPTHTYADAGVYAATLTATTDGGNSTSTPVYIVVSSTAGPKAYFTVSPGLAVSVSTLLTFTDGSSAGSNPITSYRWDFGDASPAGTTPTVTHTYTAAATHTVTLTVTDSLGRSNSYSVKITVVNPPKASFTAAPQTGCAPLSVTFTDTSITSGQPLRKWQWNFGDGNVSNFSSVTSIAPFSHVFKGTGHYVVTLTVTDAAGATDSASLPVDCTCVNASFAVTPAVWTGPAPLEVHFTDGSQPGSGILGWLWDFGDNAPLGQPRYSTEQNPVYTYTNVGTYTVTLVVATAQGAQTSQGTITVTAGIPTASFTASPNPVSKNNPVTFTDTSTTAGPAITQWNWDFGDGATGTVRNTTHSYAAKGSYKVSLTVASAAGASLPFTTTIIVMDASLQAYFTYDPAQGGPAPLNVTFTDASIPVDATPANRLVQWRWDFGDTSAPLISSTAPQPPAWHTYTKPGTYMATLTVTDARARTNSYSVSIHAAAAASFTAPAAGCAPLEVTFTDTTVASDKAITQWAWDFGDDTPVIIDSAAPQPLTHTYYQVGSYPATLTVTEAGGATSSATVLINVTCLNAPLTSSPLEWTGPAPLEVHFADALPPAAGLTDVSWSFDDVNSTPANPNIIEGLNPTHIFTVPGTYTVILTEATTHGAVTAQGTVIVTADLPHASFTPNLAIGQGNPTFNVTFTDTSNPETYPIMNWHWVFGDQSAPVDDVTGPNPQESHDYRRGVYTAYLTVTSVAGSDTASGTVVVADNAIPKACFMADKPQGGCAPFTITLTDASVLGATAITQWMWSFGDGSAPIIWSTRPSPPSLTHAYAAPGAYQAALTVLDAAGRTDRFVATVTVQNCPQASFSVNPPSGCAPLAVTFTDTSAPGDQPITQWLMDFGDHTPALLTDSAPVPYTHTYDNVGSYTATLTVTDAAGVKNTTALPVDVVDCFEAVLGATPTTWTGPGSPAHPLEVYFRDGLPSTSGVLSWAWTFYDTNGAVLATSSISTPVFTYTTPGTYTVILIMTTAKGTIAEYATIVVVPSDMPIAKFTTTPNPPNGLANPTLTINFTNASSAPATAPIIGWQWDFGDGTPVDAVTMNPIHPYSSRGIYTATLTVTSAAGNDTFKQVIVVSGAATPTAYFSQVQPADCIPSQVVFTDGSVAGTNPIGQWNWNFGDGTAPAVFTTATNPTHIYATAGTYMITLTVTDAGSGTDRYSASITTKDCNVPANMPVAYLGQAQFFLTACDGACQADPSQVADLSLRSYDPRLDPGYNPSTAQGPAPHVSQLGFSWSESYTNPVVPILQAANRNSPQLKACFPVPGRYEFSGVVFNGLAVSVPVTVVYYVPGLYGTVGFSPSNGVVRVPDVTVAVYGSQADADPANPTAMPVSQDISDSLGRYSLQCLNVGQYYFRLTRSKFVTPEVTEVTVAQDPGHNGASHNLSIDRGYLSAISGNIYVAPVTTPPTPLPGASLSIIPGYLGQVFGSGTDSAGAFSLSNVPIGSWIMQINGPPTGEFMPEARDINVEPDAACAGCATPTLSFSIQPSQGLGTLSGTVTLGLAGSPIPNVQVALGTSMVKSTDTHGGFTFTNIPSGYYYITLTKPGYEPVREWDIYVSPDVATQENFEMFFDDESAPMIEGFVTDQATGRALAGVTVGVFETTDAAGAPILFPQTVTDPAGYYQLTGVAEGPNQLVVLAPIAWGYTQQTWPNTITVNVPAITSDGLRPNVNEPIQLAGGTPPTPPSAVPAAVFEPIANPCDRVGASFILDASLNSSDSSGHKPPVASLRYYWEEDPATNPVTGLLPAAALPYNPANPNPSTNIATITVYPPMPGVYNFRVWVQDSAGNVSPPATAVVSVLGIAGNVHASPSDGVWGLSGVTVRAYPDSGAGYASAVAWDNTYIDSKVTADFPVGNYALDNLDCSCYWLVARSANPAFLPYGPVKHCVSCCSGAAPKDINMASSSSCLSGTVYDSATQFPLENTRVVMPPGILAESFRTSTNTDGNFRLMDVPEGAAWPVMFMKPGYQAKTILFDIADNGHCEPQILLDPLPASGPEFASVTGTVFVNRIDSMGNTMPVRLAHAEVVFGFSVGQAMTDLNGNFEIDNIPPGQYYGIARKANTSSLDKGMQFISQPIGDSDLFTLSPGSNTINFTLDLNSIAPASKSASGGAAMLVGAQVLSGKVLDKTGAPVVGARISLMPEVASLGKSASDTVVESTTSFTGAFNISAVPDGLHTLLVQLPDGSQFSQTVHVEGNTQVILYASPKGATGNITVTIQPPAAVTAGAQWSVDGGTTWNASGATVTSVPAGNATVTFKGIAGWTTPATQTVAITSGNTATATGTYVQQTGGGSITVTILPAAAVTAGAKWSIDNGATWNDSGATVASVPVGNATVTFKSVAGWTTPANQTVAITSGNTATATGTYVQQTGGGSITVTILPAAAVTAGAKWSIDNGATWNDSGATVASVPVGNATVTFKSVAGWTTPANQTVAITSGNTATATGTYVQQTGGGSITVTIQPADAVTAGAQWSVDGGTTWNVSGATVASVPVGNATVTFKSVAGWTTPATQTVTITSGNTVTATGTYVQTKAVITSSAASCIAGQSITFTNNSTGAFASGTWDFGDGSTASADVVAPSSVTHPYTESGVFTVRLTLITTTGSTSSASEQVTIYQPVHVDFSATPLIGDFPLPVTFTSTITGNWDTVTWDFGDKTPTQVQKPTDPPTVTHTYTAAGSFTVTLTPAGSGVANAAAATASHSITVYTAIAPVFQTNVTSGLAPLDVTFTNTTPAPQDAASFTWNFGDGSTASSAPGDPPVKHTYPTSGAYSATLTGTGKSGVPHTSAALAINVYDPVTAALTAAPLTANAPAAITFQNNSTGSFTTATWNFGDGTAGVSQTTLFSKPVQHTFNAKGQYKVTLSVTGPGGNDSATTNITVYAPVKVGVGAQPTAGPAPLLVNFSKSTSSGDFSSVMWNFGDGTPLLTLNATDPDPVHTFGNPGTYTITLSLSGAGGSDTAQTAVTVTTPQPVLSVDVTTVTLGQWSGSNFVAVHVTNIGSGILTWTPSVVAGADWMTISPNVKTVGPGAITLSYTANVDTNPRSGTIRVSSDDAIGGPIDITVTQKGTGIPPQPILSVTPSSASFDSVGGQTGFNVTNTGNGTMQWTASVTQGGDWLAITSGASGSNAGVIQVDAASNSHMVSRNGIVEVDAPGATGNPVRIVITQVAPKGGEGEGEGEGESEGEGEGEGEGSQPISCNIGSIDQGPGSPFSGKSAGDSVLLLSAAAALVFVGKKGVRTRLS